MSEIVVIPSHIIEEIKLTQNIILQKIDKKDEYIEEKFISRQNAAKMFDCDCQTITNLENEGLIKDTEDVDLSDILYLN